jgi:uncharacterized protein DUF4382
MTTAARLLRIATFTTAALLSACGGGGGSSGGGGPVVITDAGTLKLALTAAPTCGYDHVNVTVQKVRVNQSASAADTDAGWSEVVLSPAQRIDLTTLTNGTVVELGSVQLPVGTYRQMSLVLAANDASSPVAEAVTPTGGGETPASMPAGLQGGAKVATAITVTANQTSDYVLDLDACSSVRRVGFNSGVYDIGPQYTVIQRTSATGQRVTGYVATTLDRTTTRISLQSNGTVLASTVPDAAGHFVLYPAPAGPSYDVVISALGRAPAVVTGVPVTDAASTDLNPSSAPIDPVVETTHTASGTVTTGSTPVDATVQVIKPYTSGPNVVVAGAAVDASTGAFSYTLSSGAPVSTAYTANNATLSFTPDNTAPTGRYTFSVTSGGVTKTAATDVTNGDPPPVTVVFP